MYKKYSNNVDESAALPLDDKIFREIFKDYRDDLGTDENGYSNRLADLMGDALGLAEVNFEGAASAELTKQIDAVKSPSLSKKEMMTLVLEQCQHAWSKVSLVVLRRRCSWTDIEPEGKP